MTKKHKQEAAELENEVVVEAVETSEGEAEAEAKGASRKIMLTVKGVEIARTDYIRKRWAEKASRGQIAKELTKFQGKNVPYQIVFAATKGIEGGPDKVTVDEEEAA